MLSHRRTRVLLLGCPVVLLLAYLYFCFYPVLRFIVMLEKAPALGDIPITIPMQGSSFVQAYPLEQIKQTAYYVRQQPAWLRRPMIATHYFLADRATDPNKLYLLMRVLFDVPEAIPSESTGVFVFMRGEEGMMLPRQGQPLNLLWPLGYERGQLVYKHAILGHMGPPYAALAEYDYFAANFPLRPLEQLDCKP
jgi:hypothetical protein